MVQWDSRYARIAVHGLLFFLDFAFRIRDGCCQPMQSAIEETEGFRSLQISMKKSPGPLRSGPSSDLYEFQSAEFSDLLRVPPTTVALVQFFDIKDTRCSRKFLRLKLGA